MTGAGTVVVIDFQRVSAQPRLGELLVAESGGATHVLPLDPAQDLGVRLSAGEPLPTLRELAAGYEALIRRESAAPVTVVGDCSSAALALAVADRLGHVNTLLHQPTWPDTGVVRALFAHLRAELGADPDVGEPAELADAAPRALEAALGVLSADLDAFARRHAVPATSRVFADMLVRYRGWLGYLLAARDAVRAERSWFREREERAEAAADAAQLRRLIDAVNTDPVMEA